jgi:two-component system NtrC family sensor kinase
VESFPVQPVIALAAAITAAVCATAIWLRDPDHPGNRAAALLVGLAAWWSACQVLWTSAETAEGALLWHKLAAPGWAYVGPLALHLVLSVIRDRPRRVVGSLPWLYGICTVYMVLQLATPWMHDGAHMTPYGWFFQPQPAFYSYLLVTYGCALPAILLALRSVRSAPSPAERSQVRVIAAGISVPLVMGSMTAAFFPVLGIEAPRLGSVSFAILGLVVSWSYYRYGFSALTPGSFSREILATLTDGVGLVGLDGRLLSGNGALAALLGVGPQELTGLSIGSRLHIELPGELAERRDLECELERASGERIPVAVSTSPLHDKKGLAVGIVLAVDDLREVVGLRNRLLTSARLAAVGELAAGIAHEINNPMAFVRANLGELQRTWAELGKQLEGIADAQDATQLLSEGTELIEESLEGVERTASIVRDVRSFAHGEAGNREVVDVNLLLEQVLRMAAPQLHYRGRVVRRFDSVPPVLGDAQELKHVFLNLVVNAAQAIDERGSVEVATWCEAGFVAVSVRDDGPGIPEESRERIFDPFFTTRPAGEGIGLGLAISYQILRAHGGEIDVASGPGRGATVTARLPIVGDL